MTVIMRTLTRGFNKPKAVVSQVERDSLSNPLPPHAHVLCPLATTSLLSLVMAIMPHDGQKTKLCAYEKCYRPREEL